MINVGRLSLIRYSDFFLFFSTLHNPAGVTDVRMVALFTGCAWELSALVTERSHRKMEELFEMPVSVTATPLIRVWVGGSESQRPSEPSKEINK